MKTTSTFHSHVFFQWIVTSWLTSQNFGTFSSPEIKPTAHKTYGFQPTIKKSISLMNLTQIILIMLLCPHFHQIFFFFPTSHFVGSAVVLSLWELLVGWRLVSIGGRFHPLPCLVPALLIPYTQPCPIRVLCSNLHWLTLCLVRCCTQLTCCALRSPTESAMLCWAPAVVAPFVLSFISVIMSVVSCDDERIKYFISFIWMRAFKSFYTRLSVVPLSLTPQCPTMFDSAVAMSPHDTTEF
jgi:hypothetical protein